ncbi:MAG: hypothetical protein DYG98_11070 [Haliscomenobacteraceae bacterium CHB4]|nr:hypothetical protein [Haliscomenobacteraceae bacterium CHB4]
MLLRRRRRSVWIKALISRATNLIGFLQNGRKLFTLSKLMEERYQFIFNYEDYFYQQACRFALQNDKEKSLSLLGRAVEHGFYKLEDFESAIKDSTIFSGIVEDMTYQKLKRSLYGDKHETG